MQYEHTSPNGRNLSAASGIHPCSFCHTGQPLSNERWHSCPTNCDWVLGGGACLPSAHPTLVPRASHPATSPCGAPEPARIAARRRRPPECAGSRRQSAVPAPPPGDSRDCLPRREGPRACAFACFLRRGRASAGTVLGPWAEDTLGTTRCATRHAPTLSGKQGARVSGGAMGHETRAGPGALSRRGFCPRRCLTLFGS